ncbi:MAG: DUF177 domain-containing protein [Armatimonadota bacterium]|nr:DUF177 domain-containing protein [Armatimonadota bacterium]MDW8025427.1 DUF177 domain-containing protein [Armatimonadota bacterium]
MRLDLRRIIRHPSASVSRSYHEVIYLDREGVDVEVNGDVTARNDGRMIIVHGTVSGTVVLRCSRCLKPTECLVETEFEAECEVRNFFAMAEGNYEGLDEEVTSIFDESTVDVTELTRQALILALPLQPLCSADCKGICPVCGADLNEGQCSCEPPKDPRWAKLEELLTKMRGKGQ